MTTTIFDYYHYCERLHRVAALHYGAHPERQQKWVEVATARLFWGEVHGVIWGLQRMNPKEVQAAEAIARLLAYLQRHQERIDYRFTRKGGYPIGSGGIELANNGICRVRLKRSGAWWYVEKANQMLTPRCPKYNGTFDRMFAAFRRKALQRATPVPCKK